jgi:4-amino-4-deoxy-L-arabinose transferase-like glycosyltransferase
MKSYKTFILFFVSLTILLFIPNLLKKGMFVDGLCYATISNNLANGIGSFWSPYFSKTMFSTFNEHPPLVFGIQSFFFRLLGDSWYVEKIYALFIILLTVLLIHLLWKELFRNNPELIYLSFIPCILWILSDTTYLYFTNNLLECSQGLFILLAVLLILKGIHINNFYSYLLIFIAGLSLMLSFLSKGFTGLYPLIMIIIYYLIFRNIPIKKVALYNIVLLGGFSSILLLYLINENAANNINNYIEIQVLAALRGERFENIQSSRFHIVRRLIETNIMPMLVVIIVSLISFFKFGKRQFFKFRKEILFFVLLGLSGVLPMMVSTKQADYYLVTTIPLFAIALGLILIRSDIVNKLKDSLTFKVITSLLLIFSFIYPLFSINKVNKRDKYIINDLEQFDELLEDNSLVGCITKEGKFGLFCYFMRFNSVSLDVSNPYNYPLLVTDKDAIIDTLLYHKIDLETMKYSIYRRNDSEE